MRGKIYGTLGPACADVETLRKMFRAGMDGMRLNLSHGSLEENGEWVRLMQTAAREEKIEPALLIDMQGPEMRIGSFDGAIELREGETVLLRGGETAEDGAIPVPQVLIECAREGERLLLDDGILTLIVKERKGALLHTLVERGGRLVRRKSIAVEGRELDAPAVTALDRENLRRAAAYGVTGVMQPFVRGKEDIAAVRAAMEEAGVGHLRLFTKVENRTGVEKLAEIIAGADEVIIARGDLGNAYPLWELPRVQKEIERACRAAGRDFVVSTQMLHSMIHSAVPTRAEVSDIYNAALDGAATLLLTGETAVGEHPVEAVEYFVRTACEGWAQLG